MVQKERRIINFRTKDGFQIHALLFSGGFDKEEDILNTPVIIHIHGVLGHSSARGTPRLLPPALLERRISSFSVNTRMAFMGQIMGEGIFDDSINDLDAAVDQLKKEGFRQIFILGYSL